MKRFGIFLVVVVCLLLAADLLLRAAAENAAAKLIDKQIAQKAEPDVGLGGFPFLLSLFRGTFDEITIDVPRASENGLVVEDIHLTLEDVRLEALEVLAGRGDLFARSLRGRGTISESALNDLIGAEYPGVEIELREQRVTVSRDGISIPANAVVAGNRLLINAGEVLGPLELPLPALLPEVQFSSLSAERGELVLGVVAPRVRLRT